MISIAYSFKNSQNFLIQSLCLFSMLLNEDIVDTEKPDGIGSLNYVADELFLYPSVSSITHSRSA